MQHRREALNQAALESLHPVFLKALSLEVLALLRVQNQIILPQENPLSLESHQAPAAAAIIQKEVLYLYPFLYSPLTEAISAVDSLDLV